MKGEVELVLRWNAGIGESPAWSDPEQALFWIDIESCQINRFDPSSGENRVWDLPTTPGCFVFRGGGGAIIPCQDGIYDLDFADGTLRCLEKAPFDPAIWRFNDGKCDRQGRLWVGSMPLTLEEIGEIKGTLYRYDGAEILATMNIDIPNGLAFSPDGETMYRAESLQRKIYAYDYDAKVGTFSNERIFAEFTPELGFPDGATVDSGGGYWVALANGESGGHVARIKPDGELDFYLDTPVSSPLMVAFGGPNFSTLYITSGKYLASASHPNFELCGSIFAVETDYCGIAESIFQPRKA